MYLKSRALYFKSGCLKMTQLKHFPAFLFTLQHHSPISCMQVGPSVRLRVIIDSSLCGLCLSCKIISQTVTVTRWQGNTWHFICFASSRDILVRNRWVIYGRWPSAHPFSRSRHTQMPGVELSKALLWTRAAHNMCRVFPLLSLTVGEQGVKAIRSTYAAIKAIRPVRKCYLM